MGADVDDLGEGAYLEAWRAEIAEAEPLWREARRLAQAEIAYEPVRRRKVDACPRTST
jgi:hypothetical protein